MFSPTQNFLRKFTLSKKKKFLLVAALFALLEGSIFFFSGELRLIPVGISFFAAFLVVKVLYSLKYNFYWIVISFFPAFLSLSTGLVNYYFPNTVLWFRAAFIIFYLFNFYLLLLALNIFKVSASREEGIPLLNAAKTVLFLVTTLISFFSFTVLLKIYCSLFLLDFLHFCFLIFCLH